VLVPPTKPVVLATPVAATEAVTVQVADVVPAAAPAADAAQDLDATQIASIEPTAAPATKSKPSAAKGRWGIQVGAFNAYDMALNAAKRASKRVAKLVKDAQVVVDETAAKGNATLYRARLVGLSKQNAHSACRQLKAKSIDCMVFQADVALAMLPAQ
jgi:D-alanyl-D-alanine carboxypeptidase